MGLTVMKQNNHHYFGETNPVSIVSDVMGWRLDLINKKTNPVTIVSDVMGCRLDLINNKQIQLL